MPKTKTPRTVTKKTAERYAAVVQQKGSLSKLAENIARNVKGQATADAISRARKKIRSV